MKCEKRFPFPEKKYTHTHIEDVNEGRAWALVELLLFQLKNKTRGRRICIIEEEEERKKSLKIKGVLGVKTYVENA